MAGFRKGIVLFCFISILCVALTGCNNKQSIKSDNLESVSETKKIVESFIQFYNNGDAEACIRLLSRDIVTEQIALQNTKSQDEKSVHEALKNNIAAKHTLKIIKYIKSSESSSTVQIEESGSDMKLIGLDSISCESTYDVKDGKITRIITKIDKKLAEEIVGKTAGGIGIQTDSGMDKLLIKGVAPGSPAEDAGLKAGDEIIAIDGTYCSEMKQSEAIIRIRGPIGSKVLLKIRHFKSGEESDVSVSRADLSKIPKN